MIKAQFYFFKNECWVQCGNTARMPLPKIGDEIPFEGEMFKVLDIDVEYDIYDIYLK